MSQTNGWNPPERIRLRKVSRTRTSQYSLPTIVNLTLKTANHGNDEAHFKPTGLSKMAGSHAYLEKDYEQAPEVLKVDGVIIGTLDNFSASISKAKSKKMFNVSAMVAVALSGKKILKYTAELPNDKNRILYIDTKQSPYHCLIVMRRIIQLAGLPTYEDCDCFRFLALRKYTPEERLAIVEEANSQTDYLGFVVIDGIRNLVYDINSPSEATYVISKLMQWTDKHQIHLHTILHQNNIHDRLH